MPGFSQYSFAFMERMRYHGKYTGQTASAGRLEIRMVILGIDPRSRHCRVWRLVNVPAVGRPTTDLPVRRHHDPGGAAHWPSRLLQIADDLEELIGSLFSADVMAIEELFFSTRTSPPELAVAHGRRRHPAGGGQYWAAPIAEYNADPRSSRRWRVTGRRSNPGHGDDPAALLPLQQIPKPDDAADALAMAICHGHGSGVVPAAGAARWRRSVR